MITRIKDISVLSGVYMPLLPCMADVVSFGMGDDCLFAQLVEGRLTAVISNSGGNVYVSAFGGEDDALTELREFISFSGAYSVTSDFPVSAFGGDDEYTVMKLSPDENVPVNEKVLFLDERSYSRDYFNVASVLFSDNERVNDFYAAMSKKINAGRAAAAYIRSCESAVSTANAPYIYGDKAVICGVGTVPAFRNKGFASDCVSELCKKLTERGITEVFLWCEKPLVSFYKKLGFDEYGMIYIGRGDDNGLF